MQTQEQNNPNTDNPITAYAPPPALEPAAAVEFFTLMEIAATTTANIIASAPPELWQGLAAACSQSLFAKVEQLDEGLAAAA